MLRPDASGCPEGFAPGRPWAACRRGTGDHAGIDPAAASRSSGERPSTPPVLPRDPRLHRARARLLSPTSARLNAVAHVFGRVGVPERTIDENVRGTSEAPTPRQR